MHGMTEYRQLSLADMEPAGLITIRDNKGLDGRGLYIGVRQ